MDTTTILMMISALLVGAAISYFLLGKGKQGKVDSSITDILHSAETNEPVVNERAVAESEALRKELDQWKEKLSTQREKYEALIKEAEEQKEALFTQLTNSPGSTADAVIVNAQMAEMEKLKKKIKTLEDELDDAEDDADTFKKKLKQKEGDYNSLQDEFDKEKKLSADLCSKIEEVQEELADKVNELNLKVSSLDFIQEILSAKELSGEDIKQLNAAIEALDELANVTVMEICEGLGDDYELVPAEGFEQFKKDWKRRFDEWKSAKQKSWIHGKTTIAFVGEFSAGKTSIVNRILSQDNPNMPLLPVSTKATTAIPTYIAGGKSTSYQFVTPDDKMKIISEATFKKVDKNILDQIHGVSSLIQYFVMTYKNPNLDGLSILDTPGFNSNDSEDKERTLEVINECDALFWVFDVNVGTINRSSIQLIKEHLTKPLYVVINKVDTKSESEVKKVESLIKKTLADNEVNTEGVIWFSQKAPLSVIMNAIKAVPHTTERDTYVNDFDEYLYRMRNKMAGICNKLHRQSSDKDKEYDSITSNFKDELISLLESCHEAAEIPQWTEHFLRRDRYEMDEEEGTRLINILTDDIVDNCDKLFDFYEKTIEKYAEGKDAWEDYIDNKNILLKIEEIQASWKKITNRIK